MPEYAFQRAERAGRRSLPKAVIFLFVKDNGAFKCVAGRIIAAELGLQDAKPAESVGLPGAVGLQLVEGDGFAKARAGLIILSGYIQAIRFGKFCFVFRARSCPGRFYPMAPE